MRPDLGAVLVATSIAAVAGCRMPGARPLATATPAGTAPLVAIVMRGDSPPALDAAWQRAVVAAGGSVARHVRLPAIPHVQLATDACAQMIETAQGGTRPDFILAVLTNVWTHDTSSCKSSLFGGLSDKNFEEPECEPTGKLVGASTTIFVSTVLVDGRTCQLLASSRLERWGHTFDRGAGRQELAADDATSSLNDAVSRHVRDLFWSGLDARVVAPGATTTTAEAAR